MAETKLDIVIRAKDLATATIKKLDKDIKKFKKQIADAEANLLAKELDDISKAMTKARKEAEKVAKSTKKIGTEGKKVKTVFQKLTSTAKKFGKVIKEVEAEIQTITSFMVKLGLAGSIAIGGAIFVAARFESGLTNVAKTTGLAGAELKDLGKEIDLLSRVLPIASNELAEIATVAGQLGIQSSADILKFTETVATLAIVSDFTAEAAATSLARLSNVFELPIDQVDRLASAMNELENNTTATAPILAAFTQRIAVASKRVGITADQALGLSATLIDLGLRSEEAGSAVSRVLLEMASNAETFANLTGQSLDEFTQKMEVDAIGAFEDVAKAIGALSTAEASEAFEELGLNGIRLKNVLGALSGRTDLLNKNIKISTDEFKANTSLQKELAVFLKSTSNQFKILRNTIESVGLVFGNFLLPAIKFVIESLRSLAEVFLELSPVAQKVIIIFTLVGVAVVSFIAVLGVLALAVPPLIAAITTLIAKLALYRTAAFAASTATGFFAKSVKRLKIILASTLTVVGLLTIGLTLVAAAMILFISKTSRLIDEMKDLELEIDLLFLALEGASRAVKNGARSLDVLIAASKDATKATKESNIALIDELKLRKREAEIIVLIAKKQVALAKARAEERKTLTNIKNLENEQIQLKKKEDVLNAIKTAIETVTQAFDDQAAAIKRLTQEALEEAQARFEALQAATNAFFTDLQRLNKVKFNNLLSDLKSAAVLSKALFEAGGADPNEVALLELLATEQVLTIKKREVSERLAIEERRIARQAQLIEENVADEAEAAKQLQELAREALGEQIRSTEELIGLRQGVVDSVRKQLAQLVNAAVSTKKSFEKEMRDIDNLIRINLQSGFSKAKKFSADRARIEELAAQTSKAIEEGRLEDAKRTNNERLALVKALTKVQKNESGFKLETDKQAQQRGLRDLREIKQFKKQINDIEVERNQTTQGQASKLLDQEVATVKELKTQLVDLAKFSGKLTLQTNFSDVVDNLATIQRSLKKLSTEASGGIKVNLAAGQNIVKILKGEATVKIAFDGVEKIEQVATTFADKINQAATKLEAVTRALALTQNINQQSGVISRAGGGSISGPGTGTSDSILANLSNGEYVMRSAAVNKFGTGFFDRLNNLRIPKFAEGGAVGVAPPSRSKQNKVSIALTLDKKTFDLESDQDTARNMVQAFENLQTGLIGG